MFKKNIVGKEKVFLVCPREYYGIAWENLDEIFDKKYQELIVPFQFLQYDEIEGKLQHDIERLFNSVKTSYDSKSLDTAKNLSISTITELWLINKYRYTQSYITDADHVVILDGDVLPADSASELENEKKLLLDHNFKSVKELDVKKLSGKQKKM